MCDYFFVVLQFVNTMMTGLIFENTFRRNRWIILFFNVQIKIERARKKKRLQMDMAFWSGFCKTHKISPYAIRCSGIKNNFPEYESLFWTLLLVLQSFLSVVFTKSCRWPIRLFRTNLNFALRHGSPIKKIVIHH